MSSHLIHYLDISGKGYRYLGHFRDHRVLEQGHNPAVSEKQRRFMGAELARLRAGRPTRTNMTESQLREFARKPKGGY